MTPTLPTLAQSLTFVGFTAFSFFLLRSTFQFALQRNWAMAAPAILTVFGLLAGMIFHRYKLDPFFIWYLLFLLLVLVGWRRKSGGENLKRAAEGENGAPTPSREALEVFALTRQLLSLAILAYGAAFAAAFLYLYSRP